MSAAKRISLITLGEELLLGLTANSHLTYVGEQLRRRGVTLYQNLTISDDDSEIRQRFLEIWEQSDIVITSGGLGPTADDRTKESIAAALGESLVLDQASLDWIERFFREMGREMTENNRKQAFRPANGEALPNARGTAPGIWLERDGKVLVMLPGPPSELIPMFEDQVLARLEARGLLQSTENFLQIRTIGIGESALETRLQPILAAHPNLQVAYCAGGGQVDFRISFPDIDNSSDELLAVAETCKSALGHHFLCLGYDSLPKVVSDILRAREQTLALAESCTGGLISDTLTDLPGSSEFFLGSIVCYSVDAKLDLLDVPTAMIQQHTAVSEEVAMAMADGAAEKLEADYSLSVTGYAGPSGGTDENPVGTVYIGLHTPEKILAKRRFWRGNRPTIKERAMMEALNWLRLELTSRDDHLDQDAKQLRREAAKIFRSLS